MTCIGGVEQVVSHPPVHSYSSFFIIILTDFMCYPNVRRVFF